MTTVSHADRVVFPEIGATKGDVVAYYERVAPRLLPHVAGRPLSIRRFPRGVDGPGFFQKNVPPHFPASIGRFDVPRSRAAGKKHPARPGVDPERTVYPVIETVEHLAYLANQGAIELHVPTARAPDVFHPDRIVLDLDPPPGEVALVRRAAHLVGDALAARGLPTVPVATGSKGYHLVAAIRPTVGADVVAGAMQRLAVLLATAHPDLLTTVFRVANRGGRVFLDWMRVQPLATVVAPYSLRARPRAPVATPLRWDELDATAPDAFTVADAARLVDRPDPLAERAAAPADAAPFAATVEAEFAASGLVLETFDRFRS